MAAAAAQARTFLLVVLVATALFLPRLAGASTEAAAAGRGVTLRVDPRQVRPYEPAGELITADVALLLARVDA
jgi:hypothetical protein